MRVVAILLALAASLLGPHSANAAAPAAGGSTTLDDIRALTAMNIDCALGMAIYTGKLDLAELATLNAK